MEAKELRYNGKGREEIWCWWKDVVGFRKCFCLGELEWVRVLVGGW